MREIGKTQVEASSERFLKKRELAEMIGLDPRSINRYVDRGDLPKPIYLDSKHRVPRWSSSDLDEWRKKKRRENEKP
jgi:predicted DNA-binding transcriptional regulator AlpA